MAIFFEVYLRNHHGVAAATEVGGISQLLGEEVAGVDDAGDVFYLGETQLMSFAYVVFLQINMLCTLVRNRR